MTQDNNHETPSVEEIKLRLKEEEIAVDEEAPAAGNGAARPEVIDELTHLGKQFADTLRKAWDSAERQRFESEVREGVRSFADEVDKMIREVKEGTAGQKLRSEAVDLREQVQTGDLSRRARESLVKGMRWLSEEMGKLADQFTPAPKSADDDEPAEKHEA